MIHRQLRSVPLLLIDELSPVLQHGYVSAWVQVHHHQQQQLLSLLLQLLVLKVLSSSVSVVSVL